MHFFVFDVSWQFVICLASSHEPRKWISQMHAQLTLICRFDCCTQLEWMVLVAGQLGVHSPFKWIKSMVDDQHRMRFIATHHTMKHGFGAPDRPTLIQMQRASLQLNTNIFNIVIKSLQFHKTSLTRILQPSALQLRIKLNLKVGNLIRWALWIFKFFKSWNMSLKGTIIWTVAFENRE